MNTPQELTVRRIAARVLAIAVACAMAAPLAHATDISDVPMAVKTQAKPNIMFMLDNSGSMSNIVPDAPFDAGTTYLASCPALNVLAGGAATVDTLDDAQTFDVIIKTDGTPAIRKSGTTYSFGTAAGQKCFDPGLEVQRAPQCRHCLNRQRYLRSRVYQLQLSRQRLPRCRLYGQLPQLVFWLGASLHVGGRISAPMPAASPGPRPASKSRELRRRA